MDQPSALDALLRAAGFAVELFDRLPDVVFFVKDRDGRYRAVNETLVRRLGARNAGELLGRTTRELFPPPLGDRYLAQDLAVIRTGRPLEALLELHLYPDGAEGWCITEKRPIADAEGAALGLAGTSRDVGTLASAGESLEELSEVVRTIHERYGEPLRLDQLAAHARLSPWRLTRRIRALFGLTPAQLLTQTRIDAARRLLVEGDASLAAVASECGYADQSAFTRQFKAAVGLTPGQYRARLRKPGGR